MGDDRDLPTPDSASEWEPRSDRSDWVPLERMTLNHRDDIAWHDAPVPPRQHVCYAQTVGSVFGVPDVLRCACGAIAFASDGYWMEVNGRRNHLESTGEIEPELEPELPGNSLLNSIRNFFRSLGSDS